MFENIDIRKLSEMTGPERAFVSLYLSGPDGLASLKKREENIRALLEDAPEEAEHFEQSMSMIRSLLEENPVKDSGLCLFACWALDFAEGYHLTVSTQDRLWIGSSPYIRPLVELNDEYEKFLIVAVDNTSSRIIQVVSAAPQKENTVRGDVKNAVKKGGWSQKRYARRRDKQILEYVKEIDKILAGLIREEGFGRIVLLGSQETINNLKAEFSSEVADKVVGEKAVDLGAGEDLLMDEAYSLYFAEERNSETRLWDRIKAEYFSGGLAVAGPTEVLKAATTGRVESMIVTREAKIKGTQCRDCENIVHGTPQTCQICGSKSVFQVDLVNEIVRHLELSSATTDFVDPIPGLSKAGDMAALLRY
jgi:peptide subunit release factor 1 (eRF1)/predicted transcriptional regulator